jgi:DNA (cytosine-5)-methyltransferase 1
MSSKRSSYQVSEIMRRVKSKDTGPEISFRKALWSKGVRYRLHCDDLPGKPDLVIPKARLAVFIDGDYWHGNQWQRRGYASLRDQFVASPHADYWIGKISGNMQRDRRNAAELVSKNWLVLRFWESEIKLRLESCIDVTMQTIDRIALQSSASLLPGQTFAEFFAGIGLMRMGLERRGWHICFANDIDEEKLDIYAQNFSDYASHFLLGDIHLIQADEVPTVTLATASFPCNDLSLAGSMKGLEGSQSSAYWGFVRILTDMGSRRPPIVLLENVTGWIHSRKGQDFKDSLLALNNLGYSCDAFIINAMHFTPQSRQRMFVVGTQDNNHPLCVRETPSFYESDVRPKVLADYIFRHPEIDWNIRRLPRLPESNARIEDIIEYLPEDSEEWWSSQRAAYFLNQMSEKHSDIARCMIAGDEYRYATAFRRVRASGSMAELRIDGVAGCLRTPRGGSGRQILFKAGRGRYWVRLLTPRECARLQGAPDSYQINVPRNQALFGFGDAVCVPVIEWIAENYLNPLVTELTHGRPMFDIQSEG